MILSLFLLMFLQRLAVVASFIGVFLRVIFYAIAYEQPRDYNKRATNPASYGGEGRTSKFPIQEETRALRQAAASAAAARQSKSYDTSKSKLIRRKEKRLEEQKRQQQQPQQRNESEATLRAIAAIKQAERSRAATNGFNPYETRKLTSGQVFFT